MAATVLVLGIVVAYVQEIRHFGPGGGNGRLHRRDTEKVPCQLSHPED
jgi:hypothetical protein